MPDGALITEKRKPMSETPWVPGQDAETTEADEPAFEPITSQAEFEKRIKGRISKVASKYSDYEELKTFASEAQTKLSQLEKDLETERHNALKTQVAFERGVPPHRISGSTVEELEASAEAYLNEVADIAKPKAPKTSLKSGATGSDNRLDPKEKAAMMLQQMFGQGGVIMPR